jgi:TonB family protein
MVSASVAGLSMASIQAMPGFPVKAYREGYREARVVLRYTVKADGTVGNVEVLEAKPLEHFTRAASSAVAAWRFAPTGATELRKVEFRFSVE